MSTRQDPILHVIARAVIRLDGQLLVARCIGASNSFLPGGHVATGERLHDALCRELKEEFGARAEVGAYLGAIEHGYTQDGVQVHEINHLFSVTLPEVRQIGPIASLESHLEFFWQPLDALEAIHLAPAPAVAFARAQAGGVRWASTLLEAPSALTPTRLRSPR